MPAFHEAKLGATPIRDLGLTIAGTPLEPLVREVEAELAAAGLRRLRPRFYLSTEWGVPTDTVALAIPFYLARPELTELHAERTGHVEGVRAGDILRYLRHELGHVVCYAYRLHEQREFIDLFGSITQPYLEEYRPEPFSSRFVAHLPGWYAQKHPEEDWAETFAVWLTPGRDWRGEYADRPIALAKLAYCDRTIADVGDREPTLTSDELDEDVAEIGYSLDDFYAGPAPADEPRGLDAALRSIFEDLGDPPAETRPATALFAQVERELIANVYRWTGHLPERTRPLLRHLARRADELGLGYAPAREAAAVLALTTFVTALAMTHVLRGTYFP
ncbi:MAG TPA: putative zinc-binding metallopeptidase [Haliangiales bacterium]|nr:putative zinc-binding metallopeptidase [Haliangiales bacterium]